MTGIQNKTIINVVFVSVIIVVIVILVRVIIIISCHMVVIVIIIIIMTVVVVMIAVVVIIIMIVVVGMIAVVVIIILGVMIAVIIDTGEKIGRLGWLIGSKSKISAKIILGKVRNGGRQQYVVVFICQDVIGGVSLHITSRGRSGNHFIPKDSICRHSSRGLLHITGVRYICFIGLRKHLCGGGVHYVRCSLRRRLHCLIQWRMSLHRQLRCLRQWQTVRRGVNHPIVGGSSHDHNIRSGEGIIKVWEVRRRTSLHRRLHPLI
mmetsp:Transcript_23518/g.28727  ORF Transcript_23518/g.28727 Transcript_23518/m.28727 type:complete len:263 (+) Transcript_23518:134-922(+)